MRLMAVGSRWSRHRDEGAGSASCFRSPLRSTMVDILAVEDNNANLMLLHAVLDSPSYRLHDAKSVGEAIHKLSERAFSLVLLDLRLPDGDGLEVARHIRATPSTRCLPIIVITASPSESDAHDAAAIGCNMFLLKPLSPSNLRNAVADALKVESQSP